MSSEGLIGLIAALTGLVGAVFAGIVALRKERYTGVRADVAELYAYREAWLWSTRAISSLLVRVGILDSEFDTAAVRKELFDHQKAIDKATMPQEDEGAKK